MDINISYTPLSKKSLEKVVAWCEENESSSLSIAFWGACSAIGSIDYSDIHKEKGGGWYMKNLYDATYACRDIIGRIIFELIKKEDKS